MYGAEPLPSWLDSADDLLCFIVLLPSRCLADVSPDGRQLLFTGAAEDAARTAVTFVDIWICGVVCRFSLVALYLESCGVVGGKEVRRQGSRHRRVQTR